MRNKASVRFLLGVLIGGVLFTCGKLICGEEGGTYSRSFYSFFSDCVYTPILEECSDRIFLPAMLASACSRFRIGYAKVWIIGISVLFFAICHIDQGVDFALNCTKFVYAAFLGLTMFGLKGRFNGDMTAPIAAHFSNNCLVFVFG